MKRFTLTGGVLFGVVLTALTLALAERATAEPALIVRGDDVCFIFGVDENGYPDASLGGIGDGQALENSNKIDLMCQIQVTNLSGRAQRFEGFPCWVFVPSTGELLVSYDSFVTISESGQAHVKCTLTY